MEFTHYIKDIAMRKLLSLLWILLLLFILPSELSAANPDDSIGSVVAIRGKVTAADPEGSIRKLSLKSKIYLKDTLKTEKRSRLQVMFIDNTIVSLGPNSEMIISEYQWKPDQGDGGMKTKIKEGVFRIMGGAITKVAPEKFVPLTCQTVAVTSPSPGAAVFSPSRITRISEDKVKIGSLVSDWSAVSVPISPDSSAMPSPK